MGYLVAVGLGVSCGWIAVMITPRDLPVWLKLITSTMLIVLCWCVTWMVRQ